ncbi:hypothetical protein [Bacillus cereus]
MGEVTKCNDCKKEITSGTTISGVDVCYDCIMEVDKPIDKSNEVTLLSFTTYELTAELERRKETKKNEFLELVRELFELGYDYETIRDLMDEV